jgi:nitroreductase/NAD-dependent dihydropyrimidine dehydrogenase PreA subunit
MWTVIVIDQVRCVACGSCVEICHEHCMTLEIGTIRIDGEVCSTCGQCVAICPQKALSWDGVPPAAFVEAGLPSPRQLDELFKQRRSIRSFTGDRIERALLEEIVCYGAYAPTHNGPSLNLRAIVVDDEEMLNLLDRIVLRSVARIYNAFYRLRILSEFARLMGLSGEYTRAKPKLEMALERGRALRTRPAAILFLVGDGRTALSKVSAQCALCNIFLYAQTKGIGSCLWANGPLFVDRSRAARRRLGLGRWEHVLGALLLGYSAVEFRNKVEGRKLPMQWNGVYGGKEDEQARV